MSVFLGFTGKKPKLRSAAIYRAFILVIGSGDSVTLPEEVVGPITAGTEITLPNSGTYTGSELKLDLNGIDLILVEDYNFVGTAPRTKITLTKDLTGTKANPDRLAFYID